VRKAGAPTEVGRSVGTDENGRFHADDLVPGSYVVSAYAPSFVDAVEVTERPYYHIGDSVTVRMVKGGVITGVVTASSGEPVVAVRVSAIRVRDGENVPLRAPAPWGNAKLTDDRGVYRLYGLASGSYLVVAGGGQAYPPSDYDSDGPTYYPSTTRDGAAEVTVRTGEEASGINIRYRGDRGHILSGSIAGAVGKDPSQSGATLSLVRSATGGIEVRSYASLHEGRGFAIYGVADGEYDLVAQLSGSDFTAASTPRHVSVKGSDVTGLELILAPLGSIAGRVAVEPLPAPAPKLECKPKRKAVLSELVLSALVEVTPGQEKPTIPGIQFPMNAAPDEKGDFKISNVSAGRYNIQTYLPNDYWYVKSITKRAAQGSKQQADILGAGLAINTGQNASEITVTLAEGAASLAGKAVSTSDALSLPSRLRIHLVPAEPESADDAARFMETTTASDGSFSVSNIEPGRYYCLARAVPQSQLSEDNQRPIAWDKSARSKLRQEAQSSNLIIELDRCQSFKGYVIKYTPPVPAKAPAAKPTG
jgi:hypothetical protein